MVAACFGNLSFNLSAWCWRDCGLRTVASPAVKCVSRDSALAVVRVPPRVCVFVLSMHIYIYKYKHTHITRDATRVSLFRVRVGGKEGEGGGGRKSRQRWCGMPVTAVPIRISGRLYKSVH